MGISTIQSYQGSMIFEAIGLKPEFIEKYFTGTVSRVGGIGLEEIAKDYMARHSEAFDPLGFSVDLTLNSVGQHKSKSGGEKHLYNPRTIHMLQQSTRRGDYEMFKQYTQMVDEESKGITLRGQMDFNYPKKGRSAFRSRECGFNRDQIQDRCNVLRINFKGSTRNPCPCNECTAW